MKGHVLAFCFGVAAVLAGAVALATGTGKADNPADEPDDAVILGEEDLADRAEILRNMYRRITPPDMALRQYVGTWPAAWEEFGANWDSAAVDREYGAWVVPVEVTQDASATVVKDGNGAVLWRGWTDFARPESADVVLTGGLVAEEEWAVYTGIRDAVAAMTAESSRADFPDRTRTTPTNGLRFTSHEWTTNGTFRLELAYEIDTNVDVFAYAVACTSSLVVATWTNDENQVITGTNTVWTSVGLPFNGMESDWELRGTVAISNGVTDFEDSGFPEELSRLRFYAAAVAEDTDGDGLNDGVESFVYHTDPTVADMDGDGLNDGAEVLLWHTDPARADSDEDGWGDGMEVAVEFNPALATDVPHVVIQGVNYMGTTNEPGKQWVELFSTSAREVRLAGFRLEVGRDGVWSNTMEFATGTQIESSQYLLVGESNVANADIQAALDIPLAQETDPTTGVRLRWGGATNGAVADVVFIGHGAFNISNLDVTGWLSVTSVWNYAGKVQERWFPGLDTDRVEDWHWVYARPGHNHNSGVIDTDGDGLSDAEEWNGSLSPNGEPTNPVNPDSDGDGQGDYAECVIYRTDPTTWASDGDIWPWMPPTNSPANWPGSDVWELANGLNPTNADENANGISDIWEWMVGLDNLLGGADTDGDGITDWDEMQQNSNPLDNTDIGPRPYVVLFEASRPGWENGAATNDIGLGGQVRVRFLGAHKGQGVLVKVTEGRVREEFKLQWKGAEKIATFEGADSSQWYTSALLDRNSALVVKDEGKHPDYVNTLGGEYTITNFTATLVPDLDRNRQIDDEDRARAWRGEPLRMWVNDDNDNGPTADSGNDIPGQGGNADATDNLVVDGACDLLDFFPVWVDASEVLANVQGTTSCRLRQSASALNAVYTDLPNASASDFLTNQASVYGPGLDVYPQAAPVFQIVWDGVELAPLFSGRISASKGVLMLEGRSPSSSPLVFEVLLNGEPVFATELPLQVSNVADMYRWIDLRPDGTSSVTEPINNPDASSNGKNVFFLHGFNVDANEARGWNAEIFKRLHQSGFRAKFWGMTWEGDIGFISSSLHYHDNVTNAFAVAPGFALALQGIDGEKILLAHSLGNMVVAEAIRECNLQVGKYFMLNAAIAAECFAAAAFNDSPANNNMVDPAWAAYTNVTWASKWHELFPSNDDRSLLTWQGRFAAMSNTVYNFYSSGDEIFETKSGGVGPFSGGLFQLERYAWQKQEMLKGTGSLGGTSWAGWGMRHAQPGSSDPLYTAAEANAIAATNKWHFMEMPLFWHSPDFMFTNSIPAVRRKQILAKGIPALSKSIGYCSIGGQGGFLEEVNLTEQISRPNGWGRTHDVYGQRWLHSDIRDMAYMYVFKLYDRLVEKGNLR